MGINTWLQHVWQGCLYQSTQIQIQLLACLQVTPSSGYSPEDLTLYNAETAVIRSLIRKAPESWPSVTARRLAAEAVGTPLRKPPLSTHVTAGLEHGHAYSQIGDGIMQSGPSTGHGHTSGAAQMQRTDSLEEGECSSQRV